MFVGIFEYCSELSF